MRLQFCLTLFTRATPGTPASIIYNSERAHFHTVERAYADNRFLALLVKHTIGSRSRNRFLSPLFTQITLRVPRSLGR